MVTEYLLESGAKPNRANQLGVTPLIAAAGRAKKDVVKVLLQQTSTLSVVTPHELLYKKQLKETTLRLSPCLLKLLLR